LEFLTGIVTDLYVDWNRIQGTDAKHKIPQLQNIVFNGDFGQIIKFFVGR
jgi:Bardet-Biedl syndrome 7 protein